MPGRGRVLSVDLASEPASGTQFLQITMRREDCGPERAIYADDSSPRPTLDTWVSWTDGGLFSKAWISWTDANDTPVRVRRRGYAFDPDKSAGGALY